MSFKKKQKNQNPELKNEQKSPLGRTAAKQQGVETKGVDVKAVEELLPVEYLPEETKLASATFRADEDQQLCDFINNKKANVVSIVLVGNRFVAFYYELVKPSTINEITLNN